MASIIRDGDDTATFDLARFVWTSKSEVLAALLNSTLPTFGASGSDPDPEHTMVMHALDTFPGMTIVSLTPVNPDNQRPSTVY